MRKKSIPTYQQRYTQIQVSNSISVKSPYEVLKAQLLAYLLICNYQFPAYPLLQNPSFLAYPPIQILNHTTSEKRSMPHLPTHRPCIRLIL